MISIDNKVKFQPGLTLTNTPRTCSTEQSDKCDIGPCTDSCVEEVTHFPEIQYQVKFGE